MSEEIKAGEMVWCKYMLSQDWSEDSFEYIGKTANGNHLCWSLNNESANVYTYATTKNPHEKKCELLKEGETLFEYDEKIGLFGNLSLATIHSCHFHQLQGFVVELGDGNQYKVDHPIKWTGDKGTILGEGLSNVETDRHQNRCKIIGCIVLEQKQC